MGRQRDRMRAAQHKLIAEAMDTLDYGAPASIRKHSSGKRGGHLFLN
jgi:hypothetical protein